MAIKSSPISARRHFCCSSKFAKHARKVLCGTYDAVPRDPQIQQHANCGREDVMQVSDSSIFRTYLEQTPRSRELSESARAHLPGGSTRMTLFHRPYPIYAAAGEGCMLRDVDGNS